MQNRPEDKKKAAVLIVAIVFVVLFFGYRMLSRPSEGAPAPAPIAVDPASATAPTAGVQPALAATPNAATNPAAAAPQDPFWRTFSIPAPVRPPGAAAVSAAPGSAAQQSGAPSSGAAGPVISIGTSQPAATPVMQDIELQGIVTDETSVAIVRVGSSVRYLQAGASIDASTKLLRIKPGFIQIVQGAKKAKSTIYLGQTLSRGAPSESSAAPAASSPAATAPVPYGPPRL